MKKVLFTLLLVVSCNISFSQISRSEILPLFDHLEKGKSKAAHKLSLKLLSNYESDTTYMMGIVRYAFLHSGAALIASRKMKYSKLKSQVPLVEGKFIAMAGHPSTTDTTKVHFNTNIFKSQNGKVTCFSTSTNNTATTIYAFEMFDFKDNFDIDELNGKVIRCAGVLEKVELNPNESILWIMKLHVKDAILREL